jgi:hypothetical protein
MKQQTHPPPRVQTLTYDRGVDEAGVVEVEVDHKTGAGRDTGEDKGLRPTSQAGCFSEGTRRT